MHRRWILVTVFVAAAMSIGAASAADWDEYANSGPAVDINAPATDADGFNPFRSQAVGPGAAARWIFQADALALWRSAPSSLPLFQSWDEDTQAYGLTALNANQFQSPMAAGPRFRLAWEPSAGGGLETSYLRVQSFESAQSRPFSSLGYAIAETTTIYGNTWTALDAIESRLTADFQSAELLARLNTSRDWLTCTAGFRWVEWNEGLEISTPYRFGIPPVSLTDAYATDVSNSLYGLQVGLEARRMAAGGRLSLEGIAKAGVYGNEARQSSRYVAIDPEFPFAAAVSTSVLRTAGVGEIGLAVGWQVTPILACRVGYAAFWLAGLATAPEQLAGQTLVEGEPVVGSTFTGGSVLMQGLTLGLEGRW